MPEKREETAFSLHIEHLESMLFEKVGQAIASVAIKVVGLFVETTQVRDGQDDCPTGPDGIAGNEDDITSEPRK